MLYIFIFWFLVFTWINVLFETELHILLFFVFSILVSYTILYKSYKTFVSDIIIEGIAKMSFIITMSFILSIFLVNQYKENFYTFHVGDTLYKITGVVVEVTQREVATSVSLEVESMTDLKNNDQVLSYPKLLDISVSPTNSYKIFDRLVIVGEIEERGIYSNRINSGEKFLSGKFSSPKLKPEANYQVSNIKKMYFSQKEYMSKNLTQIVQAKFYETSEHIQDQVIKHIKDPYVGVAQGITFGKQENIQKDIKDIFINSGLVHILVLSGANVSFIILIFFFLLRNFSVSMRVWTTLFFSTIFIFGTGLTAPSVRAGTMVNTTILAEYFSKNFSIKKSILLSLFVLTLINPFSLVHSASLHLSYLAIFGLIFVVPKINRLFKLFSKIKNDNITGTTVDTRMQNFFSEKSEIGILLRIFKTDFIKSLLVTFFAITISVGPYLLAMSEKINLFGTIASIILEPIILSVTVLTFLTTIISFLSTFLADLVGLVNTFFISIILNSAEFLAQDFFVLNLSINHAFVKTYYFIFVLYFFVLNQDNTD